MMGVQKEAPLFKHEAAAIENHKKLSKLFIENRFLFELERKKAIEKLINNTPTDERKLQLKKAQQKWDQILKNSGSEHNRLILIQMLFWDCVKTTWLPSLMGFQG